MRLSRLRSAAWIWIASLLIVTSANGQQPKGSETKLILPAVVPAWLDKLDLSPQQKTQVQIIARDHDAQFSAAWGRFGGRYQETLLTEATVLATIEDNLTEAQRRQAHEQRLKLLLDRSAETATTANDTEAVGIGVKLTAEQEAMGRKIQEKFQARLNTLGNEVQLLHNRLLSIEMDKIVEIEKVLTKEQRQQLAQNRQAALTAALGDADSRAPAKTK